MSLKYRVKVTTDPQFTEQKIQSWLNGIAELGWELVSTTFFGQGVLWVFCRDSDEGDDQDLDVHSENPEDET